MEKRFISIADTPKRSLSVSAESRGVCVFEKFVALSLKLLSHSPESCMRMHWHRNSNPYCWWSMCISSITVRTVQFCSIATPAKSAILLILRQSWKMANRKICSVKLRGRFFFQLHNQWMNELFICIFSTWCSSAKDLDGTFAKVQHYLKRAGQHLEYKPYLRENK